VCGSRGWIAVKCCVSGIEGVVHTIFLFVWEAGLEKGGGAVVNDNSFVFGCGGFRVCMRYCILFTACVAF
jgi:hypothetical protein